MTSSYNKSEIFQFCELSIIQQNWIRSTYYDEVYDAEQDSYVIHNRNENEPLPLGMFMRTTKNNFTHAVYSISAFDGYFLTLSRSNDCAVIAHKYF